MCPQVGGTAFLGRTQGGPSLHLPASQRNPRCGHSQALTARRSLRCTWFSDLVGSFQMK